MYVRAAREHESVGSGDNHMKDERKAPGSEQPRMGGTCPELLDEALQRVMELEGLVEHWHKMWEVADADNRRLTDECRK